MMARISDLRAHEVINLTDGRRLGNIIDLQVDPDRGVLHAITVPGRRGFWRFFPGRDVVIRWDQIRKIGVDVILVELEPFGLPNP